MANRSFHPPMGSLEIGVVTLWAKVTIGATGACTLVTAQSKGITSVTRNSAGKYTFLLADQYPTFLFGSVTLMDSAASDPSTVGVQGRLFSEAVANATPTVIAQFYASDDGAAADPASGATLYFKFDMRNSSVT